MGQYYKPILYTDHGQPVKAWLYSHDYDNGLKLMEHSWMENDFVATVEFLLTKNGPWYKQQIVWAGDYAGNEVGMNVNLYSFDKNDKLKITPTEKITQSDYPYLVNHSKQQYVDKRKVPGGIGVWEEWKIHPLPLLTSEGCGCGGGDYYGKDPKGLVGSWARNIISVESELPQGYTELIFDLVE